MQDENPNAAGFFMVPHRFAEEEEEEEEEEGACLERAFRHGSALAVAPDDSVVEEEGEEEEEEVTEDEDDDEDHDPEAGSVKDGKSHKSTGGWTLVKVNAKDNTLAELDASVAGLDEETVEEEFKTDEDWIKSLEAFGPAGAGYGSMTDDGWNQAGGPRLEFGRVKRDKKKDKTENAPEKLIVCARCHELRNYGKVKDPSKESLLPEFDFERTVGARLVRTHAARTVVVMVVDSSDFDGSFPRRVASLLAQLEDKQSEAWRENKSGNVPRLVLVANKIDLLPKQISPVRLEAWVRRRAKEGGAPSLSGLFLVSCVKNWGIKAVLEAIKTMAGPRGEVWVVGAQNAGKSSLINALAKVEVGAPLTQLTEAPLPGTTLGLVRLGGILPANAKLFDTPGLLHPHQITVRLNREEQKLVQVRKEMRPRTYRVMAGDTIHVGGLVRLDVRSISASSMYITVWGSTFLICHFAKMHKADEIFKKHVGARLQPPLTKERVDELGPWVETPITITGDTWDKNSVDVVIAGMGWFGVGLKGTADLSVWTHEGVGITTRTALIPDKAQYFEKAGFTVLKGGASKSKLDADTNP